MEDFATGKANISLTIPTGSTDAILAAVLTDKLDVQAYGVVSPIAYLVAVRTLIR